MDLLKKITFNNSILAQVIWGIIIIISVCCIGYMFGKFAWYLSN
jgi:VIT1/CCC1 family predicted Fe2+/Mn2+ transporter